MEREKEGREEKIVEERRGKRFKAKLKIKGKKIEEKERREEKGERNGNRIWKIGKKVKEDKRRMRGKRGRRMIKVRGGREEKEKREEKGERNGE